MTRTTPRATPVAPAPLNRTGQQSAGGSELSSWVTAPAVAVFAGGEREVVRGSLTVGRIPGSDIILEDPLVSRVHARIAVLGDGSVAVEDLHSSNGVYVNGVRLARNSQRLRDGDRLLIGTSEISVFGARRPMLVPGRPLQPEAPPSSSNSRMRQSHAEQVPPTDRADALDVIGRLARRLAATGNPVEAVRVLSGHLNKVLLGSAAGLGVRDSLLDQATEFAIELLRWTGNMAWFDYVVELHLSSRRIPSDASLTLLEGVLREVVGTGDGDLLRYFVESLEGQRERLSFNEGARLARLARLLPKR